MRPISNVIQKLKRSIDVLQKAEGKLDEESVAFRTRDGDKTIRTNAYRQLRRFYEYQLGGDRRHQPHRSLPYQRLKRKYGMKADFWTLVFQGVLYGSLRYEVKDGALYVVYDDDRAAAVVGLKRLSLRPDLLHPTKDEAKDMAKVYFSTVVDNFIRIWQKRG